MTQKLVSKSRTIKKIKKNIKSNKNIKKKIYFSKKKIGGKPGGEKSDVEIMFDKLKNKINRINNYYDKIFGKTLRLSYIEPYVKFIKEDPFGFNNIAREINSDIKNIKILYVISDYNNEEHFNGFSNENNKENLYLKINEDKYEIKIDNNNIILDNQNSVINTPYEEFDIIYKNNKGEKDFFLRKDSESVKYYKFDYQSSNFIQNIVNFTNKQKKDEFKKNHKKIKFQGNQIEYNKLKSQKINDIDKLKKMIEYFLNGNITEFIKELTPPE